VRFDEARFSPALSVSQNIIGAKRRFDRKARWRQLDVALEEATRAAGLRDALMRLGLDAPVGSGGSGLTANARRRVGLIRAVIKRPRLVILDGVAGSASAADAELRAAMRAELPDATLVWAADSEAAAADADRILAVADDGGVRLFEPAGERDAVQPGSISGGGVPVAPPDGDDASSEAARPIDRRAGE